MSQYDKTTEENARHYATGKSMGDVSPVEEDRYESYKAGRASAKESLEIAVRALEKYSNFYYANGCLTEYSMEFQNVLAAIKERGDYP